jgi:dTDP-4-amino-4,6-dideoxygalactose transaminase
MLLQPAKRAIAMSLPFLAPDELPVRRLANPHLVLAKYYAPLADRPNAARIYRRIVNVPSHPDVARVAEQDLLATLRRLVDGERTT